MQSLGQRLRQERESRGVSLDEIAKQTRIGVRLLQAIEVEDFDQLPGGIFNKSFIRQYAEYLGLDGEQSAQEYQSAVSVSREYHALQPQPAAKPPFSNQTVIAVRLALVATAVAIILGIAWLIVPRHSNEDASPSTSREVPANMSPGTPPRPAVATTPPALADPGKTPPVSASPNPRQMAVAAGDSGIVISSKPFVVGRSQTLESVTNLLAESDGQQRLDGELPEEILLQINAHSTVWISITADGEEQWQGTMEANQTLAVQAADAIRLKVGNAGGVELTLNGKNLGALGREGEVKTITLAARALPEAIP